MGLECPRRIEDAKAALQKAEAASDKARAAARGPLNKGQEMLSHAEAIREARTAQGYAEEARIIAERF